MKGDGKINEWDEEKAFYVELLNDSDRACVVVAASKLDDALQRILDLASHSLQQTPPSMNCQHIRTLATKIDACLRAGVLDEEFAKTLHVIRRLRNQFAHDFTARLLGHDKFRHLMNELSAPFLPYAHTIQADISSFSELFEIDDISMRFRVIAALILGKLAKTEQALRKGVICLQVDLFPAPWHRRK